MDSSSSNRNRDPKNMDGVGISGVHKTASIPRDNLNPVCEDCVVVHDRSKRKEIVDEGYNANDQDSKCSSSSRFHVMLAKDTNVARKDISEDRFTNDAGHRNTTCSCNQDVDVSFLHRTVDGLPVDNHMDTSLFGRTKDEKLVHPSPEINCCEEASTSHCHLSTLSSSEVSPSAGSEIDDIKNYGPQKLSRVKRENKSRCCQDDGSSSSCISENLLFPSFESFERSLDEISISNHNPRQNDVTTEPSVPKVDPSSSSTFASNSLEDDSHIFYGDTSARDMQIEADEVLARNLQERLFTECPGDMGGTMEDDAGIAWMLQHDEDTESLSNIRMRHHLQSHDASLAHLYRSYQYPLESSSERSADRVHPPPREAPLRRNFSASSPSRARPPSLEAQLRRNSSGRSPNHAHQPPRDTQLRSNSLGRSLNSVSPPSRETQLRRNVNWHQMVLESRLNYLERFNPLLQLPHDFDERDYEMLSSLDNIDHLHAGASVQQINSLPESTIGNQKSEEICVICLEAPSIGDRIRHLPCLHKFHKHCIDTWLGRKTTCPICKSEIFQR